MHIRRQSIIDCDKPTCFKEIRELNECKLSDINAELVIHIIKMSYLFHISARNIFSAFKSQF